MFLKKLLHGIYDSTGYGVHNIIIYNVVSHNFHFLLFFYKSLILLEFMNKFHIKPEDINFNKQE